MTQARNLSRLLNKKLETFKFTATSGQTTFSDSDDAGNILSYTPENMLVTYNGVVLESGSEYTATNGTSVVLDTGADSAAEVNVYAFESVSLGGYVPVTGGTFGGNVGVTGNLTVDTNTLFVDAANNLVTSTGSVGIGTTAPTNFSNVYSGLTIGGTKRALLTLRDASENDVVYFTVTSGGHTELETTGQGDFRTKVSGGFNYTISTANSERMRIDASGRVTMPFQPAFTAYSNLGQGSLSGAGQVFPFDLVLQRGGSNYNTSTNRFTAPIAGWYYFVAQIYRNGSSSATRIRISKNGASIFNANINHNQSGSDETVQHIVLVDMAANDYVDVRQDDAGTYNFWRGHSTFVGYLIG